MLPRGLPGRTRPCNQSRTEPGELVRVILIQFADRLVQQVITGHPAILPQTTAASTPAARLPLHLATEMAGHSMRYDQPDTQSVPIRGRVAQGKQPGSVREAALRIGTPGMSRVGSVQRVARPGGDAASRPGPAYSDKTGTLRWRAGPGRVAEVAMTGAAPDRTVPSATACGGSVLGRTVPNVAAR